MPTPTKILHDESEMPTRWYITVPDLPQPPPPPLHRGTHQPIGPDDLAPLFPVAWPSVAGWPPYDPGQHSGDALTGLGDTRSSNCLADQSEGMPGLWISELR